MTNIPSTPPSVSVSVSAQGNRRVITIKLVTTQEPFVVAEKLATFGQLPPVADFFAQATLTSFEDFHRLIDQTFASAFSPSGDRSTAGGSK